MENASSADLNMIEELLARMQNNPGQLYDEVDNSDDEDYEEDDDDDDDDDGYYGEHNINTLLNTYVGGSGGGGEGEMGEAGGNMQMPNAQAMTFLQGLLGINNASNMPAMSDIEAAIGGSMGGLGGMNGPMEGGTGEFHNAMQSLIPNMGTDMAGMLAGAFAGGMMTDYGGHGGGATVHEEYDDDEDDDDDDDDDAVSDEEDEEDEEDDDEDDDEDEDDKLHRRINISDATLGAVGGLMAAGLLAGHGGNHHQRGYPNSYNQMPALMPPPNTSHSSHYNGVTGVVAPIGFATSHSGAHMGYSVPTSSAPIGYPIPKSGSPVCQSPLPICAPPHTNLITPKMPSITSITATLGNMSGGTVCKNDPLSAIMAGIGGVAIGAGIVSPMVSNLLGNSGGTAVVNKHNSSPANSVIGSNDSFISSRTHPDSGIGSITSSNALSQKSSPHRNPLSYPMMPSNTTMTKAQQISESQLQATLEKNKLTKSKEELDDDKASLGSVTGSETSGMGKSDTESVGKKTPTPLLDGSEAANSQEVGSCASIPDLASATESMRDSDTDNHSEVHNVTANLSDLDNDTHDHKKPAPQNQVVNQLPFIMERPTYGWDSMVGLDTAKVALKNLFSATTFPEVFEGTQGTCKGILLFGPSGSGKTCLARALAKESNNALFVGVNTRYLLTKHPHDGGKIVRCMFEQARHQKPAIVLFDDIDALLNIPNQENNQAGIIAKEEILAQIRGLTTLLPGYPRQDSISNNENILVLGTTNQPWLLEDRIRRMFAYNIHVKLPAEKPRHELYRTFLQNLPHTVNEEQFTCLVSKSDGYSAADINTVIRQASQHVLIQSNGEVRHLTFDDLATIMTHYRCKFNEELKYKYSSYITAATHRAEDVEDNGKIKKDKKGVKKFSHKIAKSLAVAVLSVID